MGVSARPQALPGHPITAADQRRLSVDGLLPSRAMHPADAEDAGRGLRLCDLANAAIVTWGGGTQMRLGSAPQRYDIAFSTERMTRILEYESADLTCRVEAGTRVADLQATLGVQGQRLPLDPPHPERATIGGMVAANTSGLGRARYGGVRDWVIGIAVAYPSGKVARAGGKVVKNVAGYDLMKLHTGALGTLGVIVEVNFKVQAIPETAATVFGHFEAPGPALEAALTLARRYLAPAAGIVLDRAALWECGLTVEWPWTLAIKLEGYAREVTIARDQAAEVIRNAGGRTEGYDPPASFWEMARDWSAPTDDAIVLRATMAMAGVGALLDVAAPAGAVIAQPAAGVIDVRTAAGSAASSLQRLRTAAGSDGQVVVASAPAAFKHQLDVWGTPPPGFALMRALKQALDPNGILNPGRFVGGI